MMTAQGIMATAFAPDGRRLATAGADKVVKIWDLETGNELLICRGHERAVVSLAFSPDGKSLASASWDQTARIWDLATGRTVQILRGHARPLWRVKFSPKGDRLATAAWDHTARVWDASSGTELQTLTSETVWSAAFTTDGAHVMTGHYTGNVTLWHASTGREIVSLPANVQGVMCAIASPDGHYWAIGGHDGVTYIWRALPWSLETLPGNDGIPYADRVQLYNVEQRKARGDRLKKLQTLLQKHRGILLE